ncbi:MAG TPA: NAD-dependent epimerase [Xanthomonadales bacterium]|nr:NAD-dependent epimerase [Xanthomonadales bacterium]
MATILVTGAAGFIGSHVAQVLLARGDRVVGLDNLNAYYDVTLKEARLARLTPHERFTFARADLVDRAALAQLFATHGFDAVVHLAAQAGVRYSLEDPHAYVAANLDGFLNVLECCRRHPPRHLVYASTSSVYGANTKMPFAENDNTDHPLSLYAATKKANEAMAHSYAALFGIPCTGLRFFTVYGPWGRPDMALFGFTKKILAGEPIPVFNYGRHRRDFTYVDDIVDGIVRVLDRPATPDPAWSGGAPDAATSRVPWRLYNIGNAQPVELIRYIEVLEACLGRKAERELLPLQPGDVPDTWADVSALERDVGYTPSTPVEVGVARFVEWYRAYYGV